MGYIIWGIVTASFGFITVGNTEKLFHSANAVATASLIIIVMDCVMTFFGSTGFDAAFNSWVTDVTDNTNRGRAETVMQALPLLAILVVFGNFWMAISSAANGKHFSLLWASPPLLWAF